MTVPIQQSKSDLRLHMKAALAALSESQREAASQTICTRLGDVPILRSAHTIMAFMPMPGEPNILPAMNAWLVQSRTVCVPTMDWITREMSPVAIRTLEDHAMRNDRYGVRVPVQGEPVPVQQIDAILVPGLAFDRAGNRLGRNAGFYDRFLARLPPSTVKIGMAFDVQIVDNVPIEPHDLPVNLLVTEKQVYAVEHRTRGV